MTKVFAILHLITFIIVLSCNKIDLKKRINQVNKCHDKKLSELLYKPYYIDVHKQFRDSFSRLKERSGLFKSRNSYIDKFAFFNEGKDKCILLLIQRDKKNDKSYFGYGRVIEGAKKNSQWSFELSQLFWFNADWFDIFSDNSLENLSKLTRYYLTISGKSYSTGNCIIDENYWFDNK